MPAETRAQLNERARAAGVEKPERLPNKQAVLDAIDAAAGELPVLEAVRRDIAEICAGDPQLARSSLAAIALALGAELDASTDSASGVTAKRMCARELRATLDELRARAPVAKKQGSRVDELRVRRDKRRARRAAT